MKNLVKEKLNEGNPCIGTFVSLGHPDVTEILSRMGFDWLVIDGEHSPIGFETMQRMLQAMNGSECTPIVRPQWNDMVAIKRVLDIGAHGVLIPWVNSREDAEYTVRACKYPPHGLRGFGPRRAGLFDPTYAKTANEELLIIAQIETREAVGNIDEIMAVDGIDVCYIGVTDLSLSYGLEGPNFEHPEYLEAFDRVLEASEKWKKPVGMYTYSNNVQWAIERGFTLVTVDSADTFLMRGAGMALRKAKEKKD